MAEFAFDRLNIIVKTQKYPIILFKLGKHFCHMTFDLSVNESNG